MLYDSMKPWLMYNNQTTVTLPKKGPVEKKDSKGNPKIEQVAGYGNVVFLLTPNPTKSADLLSKDGIISYGPSMYKSYTADGRYVARIGKKRIVRNEIAKTKSFYTKNKQIRLRYLPETARKSILTSKKNIVVDLGRWMELYFTNTIANSPKVICERFASFMAARLGDDAYEGYKKTLLIDLAQWTSAGKKCIVMNKRLLTNPLAILIYTIYHYPEMMYPYKDIELMIVSIGNGASAQILKLPMNELTTEKYPLLKSRISLFREVEVSADEEHTEITVEEVKAEQTVTTKKVVFRKLRQGLLGTPATKENQLAPSAADDIFDITEEIQDIDAVDDADEGSIDDELEQDILDEIESFLEENPDATDTLSDTEIASAVEPRVAKRVATRFMPERTEAEVAKIERLTQGQASVIKKLDIEDVKTKKIETEDMSTFVESTNPNIKTSKFVNFDHDYVAKKMEDDIDNAVASLSKADYPIFITGKEVVDSSDVMNIKQTRIYHLEDAKGNKSTLKFDVPVIIDDKYVFINGSRKIIGHQFILRPLVKTEPDTVQLVSWYNKVFITRVGLEDSSTNKVRVYLQKNGKDYNVQAGSSLLKNKEYETPLDFDTFSKFFYSFQIGNLLFITEINALVDRWEKMHPGVKQTIDFNKEIPVAINLDTKSLVTIPTGKSFTEFLLETFSESERAKIEKINRKPRLSGVYAKMKGKTIPLVTFMGFCVGFKELAQRTGMKYEVVPKDDKKKLRSFNTLEWSFLELEDSYLVWNNTDLPIALMMNPLMRQPMSVFTFDELDSKDTWRYLLNNYDPKMDQAMENYKNFLMDPATTEILSDFGLPTDLIELLIVAIRMLADGKYKIENDMSNMRVRSSEVIPNIVYMKVTGAYVAYRRTAYKKKPTQIRIKQNAVIETLLDGKTTNLLEEASSLNPVLELEKGRAITYKGLRGIQMDRALTLPRRGFNESMLGVCGVSTSPDKNVGVVRQLTLEPSITSTRGYISPGSKAEIDKLVSTNLFTPAELLTPLGVQHDDPDRTSIDCLYLMSTLNLVNCWELLVRSSVLYGVTIR